MRSTPDDSKPKDDEKKPEPASEKTALAIASQIEKDLGVDARNEFHDMKAGGDRTKNELKEQARILYEEAGKPIPPWRR
jgi:hypothetical protein